MLAWDVTSSVYGSAAYSPPLITVKSGPVINCSISLDLESLINICFMNMAWYGLVHMILAFFWYFGSQPAYPSITKSCTNKLISLKISQTYSWSLVHGINRLCSVSGITYWALRNVDITPPDLVFGHFIQNDSFFFWNSTSLFTRWDAKSTSVSDCAFVDGFISCWSSVLWLHSPLIETWDTKI